LRRLACGKTIVPFFMTMSTIIVAPERGAILLNALRAICDDRFHPVAASTTQP
jgi:hypothetical protein